VRGEKYFPFIMTIFTFILCSNLLGLIPFSFTVTTHLGTTIFLSYAIHNGLQVKLVQSYGLRVFSFFLPANTSFILALLLVPIEYVSFASRPISLGVRLFINILAGHTLLKVIVGFS
jgi:ATP synthase subunit 6